MYNSIKSVEKKSYTSIQEQTQKTYVKAKDAKCMLNKSSIQMP